MYSWVIFFLVIILCSCTPTTSWKLEKIVSGQEDFDIARLIYAQPQIDSPLQLEITRIGSQIEMYLNLTRSRFTPSFQEKNLYVTGIFTIGEERIEDKIPLLEGKMRLKIPSSLKASCIRALQEGKKIDILVDDFKQTIFPEQFEKLYSQLQSPFLFFQIPIKGPLP